MLGSMCMASSICLGFALGLALAKLGQQVQAMESAEETLPIFEEIESPNAKKLATCLRNGWHRKDLYTGNNFQVTAAVLRLKIDQCTL